MERAFWQRLTAAALQGKLACATLDRSVTLFYRCVQDALDIDLVVELHLLHSDVIEFVNFNNVPCLVSSSCHCLLEALVVDHFVLQGFCRLENLFPWFSWVFSYCRNLNVIHVQML